MPSHVMRYGHHVMSRKPTFPARLASISPDIEIIPSLQDIFGITSLSLGDYPFRSCTGYWVESMTYRGRGTCRQSGRGMPHPFVAPTPGSTLPVSLRNGCGTIRPTDAIMQQS